MFDVLTPESSENRAGEEHVVKLNPNRGHMFVKPPPTTSSQEACEKWDPDPTLEVPPLLLLLMTKVSTLRGG